MAGMRACALQFDVRRGDTASNLRAVEAGLREAAAGGARLVVLPEMWPTSFPGPDTDLAAACRETDASRARLAELSGELGLIVCGTAYCGAGGGKPTNRLELIEGGRALWPVTRARHFRALVVGLAILNQCYVVAANRTGSDVVGRRELRLDFPGNSLVVDPHGDVLAGGAGEPGVIAADVDLDRVREMRTRVPVAKDQRTELYERWATGDGVPGRVLLEQERGLRCSD
jgi:predicted amidohydrolase